MTTQQDTTVCTDCAMILANSELGMGDEAADRAHAEKIAARWIGFYLVLSGDEDEEAHFSWSSCNGCGSTLGGDRLAAAYFARSTSPDEVLSTASLLALSGTVEQYALTIPLGTRCDWFRCPNIATVAERVYGWDDAFVCAGHAATS